MVFGIASWRGFRVQFTDGMCLRCSIRFRRHWNLPALSAAATILWRRTGVRVAAGLILITGVMLGARGLDRAGPPPTTVPPETVLVPAAPVDEDRSPARSILRISRRLHTTAPGVAPESVPYVVPVAPPDVAPPLAAPEEVVVTAAEPDVEPIAPVSLVAPVSEPPVGPVFAAMPHAGLTEQAP
jgi:hypothetical protein